MQKNYYFTVDGYDDPAKASIIWQELPAPDPENPHLFDPIKQEIDGKFYAISAYDKQGIWDFDYPAQIHVVNGEGYTDEEYAEKFTGIVFQQYPPQPEDEERFPAWEQAKALIDEMNANAEPQVLIKPEITKPATNEDGSLADRFVNVNYWQGPAGWTLREGVEEITFDEYKKALGGEVARSK